MPFVSGTAHLFAGTTTLLKIMADSKTEKGFDQGDLLTLTGNVAGVIGSVILLGGITAGAAPLAVAAILIEGATILTSIGVLPLTPPTCPPPPPPAPEPEAQGEQGSIARQSFPSVPTVPTPAIPGAELEISIIELNGVPEKYPAKIKVDFPPIAVPETPQDEYGCCTGTQDNYS